MGAAISVRVVAVNGGHVIELDSSRGIKTQLSGDSKAQHWEVERRDPNRSEEFALKNLSDGKYLRAPNGNAYTPCTTGDKQFWAAEPGEAPGSFWLRNLEFKDAYLCNANGYQTANNVVYMWPKQQIWVRALTWYVRDVNAKGFLSLPTGAPTDTPEGKKAVEDLKAKEAALVEREKKIAEQEKQASENERKAKELAEKEKQFQEQQRKLADAEKKATENETKAKELANKEKELSEADQQAKAVTEELERREKEVKAREKSVENKRRSMNGASGSAPAGEASLKDKTDHLEREKELNERQKQLDAREKELSQREQRAHQPNGDSQPDGAPQPNGTSSSSATITPDAAALERENKSLKAEIERLKAIAANAGGDSAFKLRSKRTVGGNMMSAGPAVGHNIPKVQPGNRLPGGWDPHLMARFEAGKKAMMRERVQRAAGAAS